MKKYSAFIYIILFISGCSEIQKIVKKESPHEKYEQMLRESGLLESALGKAWMKASADALNSPVEVEPPYEEQAYFFDDDASAFSYIFESNRGENISVKIDRDTASTFRIFIDLFKVAEKTERIAFAEGNEAGLQYEISEDGKYLIRVQPELLKGGSFTLRIEKSASLVFPVTGKDSRAIGSVWGDSRDAGARRHEGVDIFAPKRTPVIAAADGVISRTGITNLGGKVVWLFTGDKSLYYAHLDSQIVSQGNIVKIGDTLGLVGNTGNARTTPPHLHFGIYVPGEGAINPYPFVRNVFPNAEDLNVNADMIGRWGRVRGTAAYLRSGKTNDTKSAMQLKRNTAFMIYGGSGNWFKVKLPDNTTGLLRASDVESAENPFTNFSVDNSDTLKVFAEPGFSLILPDSADRSLPVYGSYNDYLLVNIDDKMILVRKS